MPVVQMLQTTQLKDLDPATRELAVAYLRKAAEKGDEQAKEALRDNASNK